MRTNNLSSILFIVLAMALSSCFLGKKSSSGSPFSTFRPITEERIYQIRKDSSSISDITNLFGAPAKRNISDQGETYVYNYFDDSLYVRFNTDRKVSGFLYTPANFAQTQSNVENDERRIRSKDLNRIETYNTVRSNLNEWFGAPNLVEESPLRYRLTYLGREGVKLVVYTTKGDERVINWYSTTKEG